MLAAAGGTALYVSATPALSPSLNLPLALILLVLGGLVGQVTRSSAAWLLIFASPGGCLLGWGSGVIGETWIRILVMVTAVVGGTLVADFDKRHQRPSLAIPLLAISCVGVYFTVPDTEQAVVLLAVGLLVAMAAWPVPFVSLGTPGALASVGLLAWVFAVGGAGRQSAIVGGVACLALLVIEPLCRAVLKPRQPALTLFGTGAWSLVPVAAVQLVFVSFASRVVGLRPSVAQAAVLAAVEGGVAAALLALSGGRIDASDDGPRLDS